MYDRIFVESVLKACIADGVDGTEFKVFSTYIQQVQTDTALIDAMLVEYVNFAYEQDQILPEEFYERKEDRYRKDGLDVSAALS